MEKLQQFIAWHLPKNIVKWAAIRLMVYGTQGSHSNQIVPELTCIEALNRWS
jgi:hypothetical protein